MKVSQNMLISNQVGVLKGRNNISWLMHGTLCPPCSLNVKDSVVILNIYILYIYHTVTAVQLVSTECKD